MDEARRKAVEKIFLENLGRPADKEGLKYWMGRTDLSGDDLARNIVGAAPKTVATRGPRADDSIPTPGFDEARRDEINRVYYNDLGRTDPDEQGLKYWMGRGDISLEDLRRNIVGASPMADQVDISGGGNQNSELLADQGYASFLRNMNFNESQIQSSLQAANEAAARRITSARPGYERQRQVGTENIDRNFEGRGMFRSGRRLLDRGRAVADIDRNEGNFIQGIQDENAARTRRSAQDIAAGRRNNVEQQIGARDRLTQRSVQP